jgi:hypothetical protein
LYKKYLTPLPIKVIPLPSVHAHFFFSSFFRFFFLLSCPLLFSLLSERERESLRLGERPRESKKKIHRRREMQRPIVIQTKELDMLIIHVGMELKLHKILCHFLVAQLQDLEPNVSTKHKMG